MVLKFFAGLTHLEDISDNELLSISSEDARIGIRIELATIHFLFEAKHRIKILNALSKVTLDDYTSPFDNYVLGYIASLTTCSWKIEIEIEYGASVVAMLAKGTLDSERENLYLYPAEGLPVSLSVDGTGSDCIDLSAFFKTHPSFLKRIISLKLQGIGLDGHSCKVFSESISLIPHLQVLDLVCNGSTQVDSSSSQLDSQLSSRSDYPASAVKLIDALKTQTTVKLLDFTIFNIGYSECDALAQWLSSPTCSLRVLDIGYNDLSCQSTLLVITSLCQNCTLNELDISESRISLELLPSLIELPLMRLNLNDCRLGAEEMCAIARALCGNSKLEILILDRNPIRDEGAIALANTLMQNKTLKQINLLRCRITEQGAQALQNSLEHNHTLLQLSLASTSMEITDKRIQYDYLCDTPPIEFDDY